VCGFLDNILPVCFQGRRAAGVFAGGAISGKFQGKISVCLAEMSYIAHSLVDSAHGSAFTKRAV
jgi:hypothetical protein